MSLEKEMSKLEQGDAHCYLTNLAVELEEKRNKMAAILRDINITPIMPDGAYFIMGDISKIGGYL